MNKRTVVNNIGKILLVESFIMILPAIIAMAYGEMKDAEYFLVTLVPSAIISLLCIRVKGSKLTPRDGYVVVALSWILISIIGAIPLYLSGAFENYAGALFEIVSGFTTTGASVLEDPGVLGHGMQFFRCFSHWIGGMGVLVFVLMLIPLENDSSMLLIRAEVPGPTAGKLVPKMKNTSRILYGIYGTMTLILAIVLICLKMPVFDAFCYAFGTAGTGGFSITSAGISAYNSPAIEVVISVAMLLFGVNFNVYFLFLLKRFKDALRDEEVRVYFGIVAFAVITITVNILRTVSGVGEALRLSLFQVSSIMTTTGFATADFDKWPEYSRHLLTLIMIIGGCAGSTAGGMKVSRIIILWKSSIAEIKRIINPKQVVPVRVNGVMVENRVLQSVKVYAAFYWIIVCLSVLLLSLCGFDFTTNVTAVLATFNNIGPGLGQVGPMANYSCYPIPGQLLLTLLMLTGRLEIFPMFLLFAKSAHDRR